MNNVEVSGLSFSYDRGAMEKRNYVLSGISFTADEGETVGLIGANGAGKSTLLKLFTGLLTGYEGDIRIGGVRVEKGSLADIRRNTGYVFQDSESQLFMSTVYEDTAFAPRNYGFSEEEVDKRTIRALESVHMEQMKDRQIYRLSGGQKKLASIATILSMEPGVILLDEPSVALDPRNRRNLIHVLNELPGTKIIASHDLDFIYDTCRRAILISDGRIAADGPAEEILRDQALLEENGLELPLSFSRENVRRDHS
ncbi:energy-coupling factor ABC transporter ATP-binding protein [Anaerostipes sp.]|uniref:energy-coupling factor ABC transporter ATP-binding protein n=1 Tax=Anaerostipes sp. TaxID=1872530 RepID=UPI0025C112F1|nr:ABC transporter ATP-binding protein [Anaerostipes sp.]MBS7009246.1 ABC transporter ATP-binding protein [Anaerostipes sp.]